jgi:hypothetical protein
MKYLALDVELGGLEPETSLLQAYFAVLDDKLELLDSLNLHVRPDNNLIVINPESLEVTRIDLKKHFAISLPYKSAGTLLYNFLKNHYDSEHRFLTPLGHFVKGDINRVVGTLISKGSWESFVSPNYVDTGVIAKYEIIKGKISPEGIGLQKLLKYFKIPFSKNELHDAKTDTLLTVEVYRRLLQL